MSENTEYREGWTIEEVVDATRRATLKEVGQWLKGRCIKTHLLGDFPTGYVFKIDVLAMNTLLEGKMPEEVKDETNSY